jgi:hypothetical protein
VVGEHSIMRAPLLVLAIASAAVLMGCSSPPQPATPTAPTANSVPASSSPELQPTPTAQLNEVGKTVSNGGITLTVKAARTTDSILLNETSSRPGSGYERYTKTPAGSGAKYVVVETHVVNNAKTSLDLTCGLPVRTALVDDQQRNCDPIDDLYKIKGNPECNADLQPGFESDMTWAYRIPAMAKVLGWGFQDSTDVSMLGDAFTVVHLQV